VRVQLERTLASELFLRSERLSAFLRFVVEQTLDGRENDLKEQMLGAELYGKGAEFDGASDPIVRVDARRLRDKLREYYAESPQDPIRILLPKGSYVPVFEEYPLVQATAVAPASSSPDVSRSAKWRWLALAIGLAAAIGVTMAWSISHRNLRPPNRAVLLSNFPGSALGPALSPDGESVAFSWRGPENTSLPDIWIKTIKTGMLRRLTQSVKLHAVLPAWAPDNSYIAFIRRGQGVFLVPVSGGGERRVVSCGTSANYVTWTPDAKSVLVRDREREGPFGIYQIFIDTGERRGLTQPQLGYGDWRFSVSPDGKTLAFTRFEHPGSSDVYVVPMQGGAPRRVTNWNGGPDSVVWSSDGRHLIYSMGEKGLWRISASLPAPGRGQQIPGASLAASNLSISYPVAGRPGRIAFQSFTRDLSFRIIDLAAPLQDGVFREVMPFPASTRHESPGPFSPDGRRFAFVSGQPSGIWTAQVDGVGLRQVSTVKEAMSIGGWSPDARKLVYHATVDGNTDVFVVDVPGGSSKRLTTDAAIDWAASWSRDGRWIYFASTRAGSVPDIWRIPAEGGPAVRITYHGGFQARESPDRYLYYLDRPAPADRTSGTAKLMRMPVDGGPETLLLSGFTPLGWSMSDSGIFYLIREEEFDAINHYNFSDQQVTRVGRLAARAGQFGGQMTTSPDGRWALVTLQQGHSDIMVIDEFR
jgi:Tol biopolymer transport system component